MDKTAEISRRIATLIADGMSVRDAIDAVLGAGSFLKIADDLWNAFRAKLEG